MPGGFASFVFEMKEGPKNRIAWDDLALPFSEIDRVTDWLIAFPAIFTELDPVPDQRILDYGCGDGQVSKFLASQGIRVIGVDNSPKMIELAERKNNHPLIQYRLTDGISMPFLDDESIDGAMANFVFLTIPERRTIVTICREIARVLEPGVKFIVCNNSPQSLNRKFASFEIRADARCIEGGGHPNDVTLFSPDGKEMRFVDYFWTPAQYESMLSKAGFSILKIIEPKAEFQPPGVRLYDELKYPPYSILVGEKEA